MNKKDVLLGFFIGFATTLLGSYLFITFFTEFKFIAGIQIMKSQGNLGKIITLGSILTLISFGILLKMNKEMMARGVVLAVIALAILTLFI
ncbi:hypothetical protein FLSI110296_12350 [Flavobacterium sinopsychrotolerans]|uniref:Uncharacterized protein n=1 Tax=Flavobacterium sinopsychrotolerans TaxID=604089 RepID=A0A1H8QL40_9FLAO|nr:hypothetical protein [Flavobacterium sinopsychrotolerans]SEO54912.1 hypothetical protein SAMN04487942_3038 [Flavobacterium sinopsychrotolerans]